MATRLLTALAASLLLTLLFEGAFALAAGVRTGRGLLLVLLVNTLTNPPVVLLSTLFPSPLLKFALEAAVVLTEWLIYRRCADFLRRPFLFSLSINAFSYLAGAALNKLMHLLA